MQILEVHNMLYERYGELSWWPARSPYEVMVGAILTQNTAWSNVEKALANFNDELSPEYIEELSLDELSDKIRPAGFFNQKAVYLKTLTEWYKQYNYSVEQVKSHHFGLLRQELLALKGIGPETADAILLYAFDMPTFVVDAYTKRLLTRLKVNLKLDYDSIQKYFHTYIDENLYNNFHAMVVINAKEHCKSKLRCTGCPLESLCATANLND